MARASFNPRRAACAAFSTLVMTALVPLGDARAAGSAHHRFYSDPVAQAVGRAVEFWGGTPCGGTVGILFGPDANAPGAGENVPGTRGGVAAMWAEWSTPAGTNQFVEGPHSFSACIVHINRGIWPTTQSEDAGFADFCKEMVHEYGHFEGYSDVGAVPGTIQYEQPDLARVPSCEHFSLRFGERIYSGPPPKPSRRRTARQAQAQLGDARHDVEVRRVAL